MKYFLLGSTGALAVTVPMGLLIWRLIYLRLNQPASEVPEGILSSLLEMITQTLGVNGVLIFLGIAVIIELALIAIGITGVATDLGLFKHRYNLRLTRNHLLPELSIQKKEKISACRPHKPAIKSSLKLESEKHIKLPPELVNLPAFIVSNPKGDFPNIIGTVKGHFLATLTPAKSHKKVMALLRNSTSPHDTLNEDSICLPLPDLTGLEFIKKENLLGVSYQTHKGLRYHEFSCSKKNAERLIIKLSGYLRSTHAIYYVGPLKPLDKFNFVRWIVTATAIALFCLTAAFFPHHEALQPLVQVFGILGPVGLTLFGIVISCLCIWRANIVKHAHRARRLMPLTDP